MVTDNTIYPTSDDERAVKLPTRYDDCIVGVVDQGHKLPIVCYDRDKIILKLVQWDGMTEQEALEFFEYNIQGVWMGARTPGFLRPFEAEEFENE